MTNIISIILSVVIIAATVFIAYLVISELLLTMRIRYLHKKEKFNASKCDCSNHKSSKTK